MCEWAFCGRHGQASSRLWSQRWRKTTLCGPAIQWQQETHTNELVPYPTTFVVCVLFFQSFCLSFLPLSLISIFSSLSLRLLLSLLFFSCQLFQCALLLYSESLLTLCLSFSWESRTAVWWWGSRAFGLREMNGCCMVKFNTYFDYSYRFRVVWDVVAFALLVPLIHILWLNILWVIFVTQKMVLKHPIWYTTWLWIYGYESLWLKNRKLSFYFSWNCVLQNCNQRKHSHSFWKIILLWL